MNLSELQYNDILLEVSTGKFFIVDMLCDAAWHERHHIVCRCGLELYFDSDLQDDAFLFVTRPQQLV